MGPQVLVLNSRTWPGTHLLHRALPPMSAWLKLAGIMGSVSASQKVLSMPFRIPYTIVACLSLVLSHMLMPYRAAALMQSHAVAAVMLHKSCIGRLRD